MKLSQWQSGTIAPQEAGWYKRRHKYNREWLEMGDACFKDGTWWLHEFYKCDSEWQTHNGELWQWRGRVD